MARRKTRRRRNPLPKVMDVLPTLVLLAAAYWLYRKFAQAGGDISRGAQEAWNLITTPPVTNVNSIRLPNGAVIPVDALTIRDPFGNLGTGITQDGNFLWQGVEYQISGSDPTTGYYTAKRIVT